MPKTIVGFFCGTGYDYHADKKAGEDIDWSFEEISSQIQADDDTKIYGYSGCHNNGGGLFAYGVDIPCNDLYAKIKKAVEENEKERSVEKIKLMLIAHSRGCLSALMLIKKIHADQALKDAVEIIVDLRDPVPGNLIVSTKIDVGNLLFIANQLRDLRECENVKEAHITIQEKGIIDIGFSVLIPNFHPRTILDIEYIPGVHDIQENISGTQINGDYYLRNDQIYNLGLYKSLQILQENSASPNKERIANLVRYQCEIYQDLLYKYKSPTPENLRLHTRDVHFGGQFIPHPDLDSATSLNTRHAKLAKIDNAIPLLVFKGTRPDIHYANILDKKIDKLLKNPAAQIKNVMKLSQLKSKRPLLEKILDGSQEDDERLYRILLFSEKLTMRFKKFLIKSLTDIEPKTTQDAEYILRKLLSRFRSHHSLTIKNDFMEELRQYQCERIHEAETTKSQYHSFWGRLTKMSSDIKRKAVDTMLTALRSQEDEHIVFRDIEIEALRDSRAGAIVQKYETLKCLPSQFTSCENSKFMRDIKRAW